MNERRARHRDLVQHISSPAPLATSMFAGWVNFAECAEGAVTNLWVFFAKKFFELRHSQRIIESRESSKRIGLKCWMLGGRPFQDIGASSLSLIGKCLGGGELDER